MWIMCFFNIVNYVSVDFIRPPEWWPKYVYQLMTHNTGKDRIK